MIITRWFSNRQLAGFKLLGFEAERGQLFALLGHSDRQGGRVVPVSSQRTWRRDAARWLARKGVAA